MAGRWLREALGRHFDGSWEASREYEGVQGNMKIVSGPPEAPKCSPKTPKWLPRGAEMVKNRCRNASESDDQNR